MKIILNIPYPPSFNKTYFNRVIPKDPLKKNRLRGRGLTKEASAYKSSLAMLIHSKSHRMKFWDQTIKVTILDNPSNLRGDNHNCEKIVFDAIQLSGIINNDKQIIAHEIIPGIIKNPPSWTIKIEPYERPTKDLSL
jgi:Holliday junction resolvase RusA-like endonuclease